MPMKIGLGTVSLNIVLSIVLSRFLGLRGVVLATAISNILTCIIALLLFHKKKHPIPFEYFVKPLIKILFAVAVSTVMSNLWLRAGLKMCIRDRLYIVLRIELVLGIPMKSTLEII